MQPRSLALALALLPFACNDDAATQPAEDTDAATTAVSNGSTGGESCIPGYETCSCAEGGQCLEGLQCLSDLCVEMPIEASTSGAPTDESTSTTAPIGDESSSSTGEPIEESSSSSSTGEEASSSSTGVEAECFEGDTFCAAGSSTLLTCVEEQWTEMSCSDGCLVTGHTGENCDVYQQQCYCDGFSDYDCEIAMEVVCFCYFEDLLGESCTQDQREEFYQWCFQDTDPVVACFGSYYTDAGLDCDGAIANCL